MKRGEVWLINFDPTIGDELRKTRPAVIVSDDSVGVLALKVIVPITDWKDRYAIAPWMVHLTPNITNGLSKPSAADCFQVRSVSQQRFIRQLGSLPDDVMRAVSDALAHVLSI